MCIIKPGKADIRNPLSLLALERSPHPPYPPLSVLHT